jgi:hypothetical protein
VAGGHVAATVIEPTMFIGMNLLDIVSHTGFPPLLLSYNTSTHASSVPPASLTSSLSATTSAVPAPRRRSVLQASTLLF